MLRNYFYYHSIVCLLAVIGINFYCSVCVCCLAVMVCRVLYFGVSSFAAAAGQPRTCHAPCPTPAAAGVPVVRKVFPYRAVSQAAAIQLSPSVSVDGVGGCATDTPLPVGLAAGEWDVLFLSTGLVVRCENYWSAVHYSSECGGAVVNVSTLFGATLLSRCRSLWIS